MLHGIKFHDDADVGNNFGIFVVYFATLNTAPNLIRDVANSAGKPLNTDNSVNMVFVTIYFLVVPSGTQSKSLIQKTQTKNLRLLAF
jgi:hypothetical protein